jgi:phosphopantetheine adenylyltransferase
MGLFGDDELQDERLKALENHLRRLTEAVQQNQLDLAASQIKVLGLEAQIGEKVSAADFDPIVIDLNEKLGKAREVGILRSSIEAASRQTDQPDR